MDIQNDLLRFVLSKPFGWNLNSQGLLSTDIANKTIPSDDSEITEVDAEIRNRAGMRLVASEINKQINIEDVVERADKILQSENTPMTQETESDQGWIDECLDGAGKSYNDDLKDYWAKLLAGEIKDPGRYSKRIINLFKELSSKDAARIKKMCQYVMHTANPYDSVILRYNDAEWNFDDMSFLKELRLVEPSSTVTFTYHLDSGSGTAYLYKRNVGLLINIKGNNYNLPVYAFTELGKEVLSIIDDTDVNIGYLKAFSKNETERNKNLSVIGGNIQYKGGKTIFVRDACYFEIPEGGNLS